MSKTSKESVHFQYQINVYNTSSTGSSAIGFKIKEITFKSPDLFSGFGIDSTVRADYTKMIKVIRTLVIEKYHEFS